MNPIPNYLAQLLYVVLPYLALTLFFLESIRRYKAQKFTYSSLSTQFLENHQHFWSLVPFHYGIILVLFGHVTAFLLPSWILAWNQQPLRLYVLELTGLVLGLLTLVGLLSIVLRRLAYGNVRAVTSPADWVLYGLLLAQVGSGVYIALFHPWGSSWFAAAMAPYLWSVATLNPNPSYLSALPLAVQLHVVNAWLVIGFFPFTRLVHVLVIPNPYLWRKPQVVRWYRRGAPDATFRVWRPWPGTRTEVSNTRG